MRIRFWGTRGSLPVSLTADGVEKKVRAALEAAVEYGLEKLDSPEGIDGFMKGLPFSVVGGYGGGSSCVEIEGGSEYVICDMGSGFRKFGVDAFGKHGPTTPQTYNIFMSHVHWDHVMGLPFFTPAFVPGNKLRIHGCHDVIEQALRTQQSAPGFPVDFDTLAADIEFVKMTPGDPIEVAGFTIVAKKQLHEGDSYGYRFEKDGKSVVYTTDSEHKQDDLEQLNKFVEFFRDADLVIFDAMYSLADAISVKADWGHSSNVVGVELCARAGVKHFCMFHHEPVFDDAKIDDVLQQTRRYEELARVDKPVHVSAAYDGLVIDL